MSQQATKLRETIDRMVEDAIRRILPNVMNEVLLRTIAGSGVVQEQHRPIRPASPSYSPETGGKRVRVVSKPQPLTRPARRRGKPDLSHLLDEGAGSEFYERAAGQEPTYEAVEEAPEAPPQSLQERVSRNIQALPPEIQAMAEGMELDEDDGEMWEDESIVVTADDVRTRDLGTAARRVGMDFSRMQALSQLAEQRSDLKKPKMSAEDMKTNAQFEEQRLKRMRERLNGGKPLD